MNLQGFFFLNCCIEERKKSEPRLWGSCSCVLRIRSWVWRQIVLLFSRGETTWFIMKACLCRWRQPAAFQCLGSWRCNMQTLSTNVFREGACLCCVFARNSGYTITAGGEDLTLWAQSAPLKWSAHIYSDSLSKTHVSGNTVWWHLWMEWMVCMSWQVCPLERELRGCQKMDKRESLTNSDC